MSLNKVILVGYAGRDPEVRYFDSGNALASFTIATSERGYKLANGTEVPERTEWHNIVARRDLVPFVEKWVKKGSGLYVEGKLRHRNYEDQQGIRRYVTEIYADKIEFFSFGRTTDAASQQSTPSPSPSTPPNPQAVQSPTAPPQPQPVITYSSPPPHKKSNSDDPYASMEGDDPDDLPF
ncbi:MAG: single-stranded DNA-binding protein [Tannerellaceae bacterium]|jgi:single-strand DNA-binding protein|nr:single-stranded DNA-binding protein [Tannerellaceae bacterium]